eukprot:SAG31_NODE_850_length_11521_cov_47.558396_6_plen_86_part_00
MVCIVDFDIVSKVELAANLRAIEYDQLLHKSGRINAGEIEETSVTSVAGGRPVNATVHIASVSHFEVAARREKATPSTRRSKEKR